VSLEEKYVEKAEILFNEAIEDMNIACYNKAVSAFYFSVEALANALLAKCNQRVRGFRGRINIVAALVSEEIANDMLRLYELRVLADHKETLVGKQTVYEAFEIAKKIYAKLKQHIEEER